MSTWYTWLVQTGDLSRCDAGQLAAVEEVYHDHGAYLKRSYTIVTRSTHGVFADSRGDFEVFGDPNEQLLAFARSIRVAAGFDVEVNTSAWFDERDPDCDMTFKLDVPLPEAADEYADYEGVKAEGGDDV